MAGLKVNCEGSESVEFDAAAICALESDLRALVCQVEDYVEMSRPIPTAIAERLSELGRVTAAVLVAPGQS